MLLRVVSFCLVCSCGGDSDAVDAGADAELDASSDVALDAADFASCEGMCAVTDVSAEFGEVTEPLDLAYFGFEADGSLRVEIYGDAVEGCPTMDSPSPGRTIVIPSLPAPSDTTPIDVVATLLDFEGTLTTEPLLRASSALAAPVAARLTPRDTAFVRFDLDAVFEGGTASGAVYATHCDTLDAP